MRKVEISVNGKEIEFEVKKLICAGYTGRNRELVMKHIKELELLGVPPPPKVPMMYEVSPHLITTDESVEVGSDKTSGEVEYVLLFGRDEVYVTVGSDHTDREVEKIDVRRSKELCPKVIAKEAWRFEEVKDYWDEILIRSFIKEDDEIKIYQEGRLSSILHPNDLVKEISGTPNGLVLFSGTIPLKEKLTFSKYYKIEMVDPVRDRSIVHQYNVIVKRL